jgi:hypothetical protein
LFQEHVGDLIRRELRSRSRWVPALDQGQFHPLPASRALCYPRLGQAAAKNLSRHVFEFTPLLHSTHFHGAQEIIGEIESRLHSQKLPFSSFPSNCFSGGGGCITPFGGLISLREFLGKIRLTHAIEDLVPFTLNSPNAIPPAQTCTAFFFSAIVGASRFAHTEVARANGASGIVRKRSMLWAGNPKQRHEKQKTNPQCGI